MRNKKIFRVTIIRPNGEELNVTRYVPYPVEWRDTLDETYDEAVFELKCTKFSEPFTFGDVAVVKVGKKEQRYVILKDDVTALFTVKMWNHSIRLCEETAVLERYPAGGGKCFTQPMVKDYMETPAMFTGKRRFTTHGVWDGTPLNGLCSPNTYTAAIDYKKTSMLTLYSMTDIGLPNVGEYAVASVSWRNLRVYEISAREKKLIADFDGENVMKKGWTASIELPKKTAEYRIEYEERHTTLTTEVEETNAVITVKAIACHEHSDLTVYEAGKRLCETSEAIVEGEKPRFTFSRYSSDGKVDYATIKCPEISVGNNRMLWEAFCELGHYVHAIPRLYAGGVIKFDRLGRMDKAVLPYRPIQELVSASGERYCGSVDTIAQNLVPSEETVPTYAPLPHMWMTVRSESGEVRITDTSAKISTEYPIYKLLQLWAVGVKDTSGKMYADVDITKYVFEASEYRTLELTGGFPLAKTYGLCYTEGEEGITGLLYKEEHAVSAIFNTATIYNILSLATGASVTVDSTAVVDLAFRVKYIPIVSARVKASKSDKSSHATEYLLPYNQTADRPNVAALSENIRGTLKRYSSTEKKLSYLYPNIDKLPEVGQKFDDAYYINEMAVSLRNHQYAIATLGLSKHYNALGKGMALPSQLRQYEISEKNVQDRYVVAEEYVLVSNDTSSFAKHPPARFVKSYAMYHPVDGLKYRYLGANSVMYDAERNVISSVMLPVIGMPIANSAVFAWRYKDNYSAGVMSINPDTETAESITVNADKSWGGQILNSLSGNETPYYRKEREVEYADLYGEAHSMGFSLYQIRERSVNDKTQQEDAMLVGNALPDAVDGYVPKLSAEEGGAVDQAVVQTSTSVRPSVAFANESETEKAFKDSLTPVVLHKDCRETICCTYQLNYVGDGIVIGAGMAKITLGIRNDVYEREFTVRLYANAAIDEVNGIAPEAVGVATYKPSFTVGSSEAEYDLELCIDGADELPEHAAWALRDNYGNFIMGANKPFAPVYYKALASLEERDRLASIVPGGISLADANGLTLAFGRSNAAAVEFYAAADAVYYVRPTHEGAQDGKCMHMENPSAVAYESRAEIIEGAFFCLPMKAGKNELLFYTDGGTYPLRVTDLTIERKSRKTEFVFSGTENITFVKCSGAVGSGSRGYQSNGCFHLRGQVADSGSDAVVVDVSSVPEGRYKIGLCGHFDGVISVNGRRAEFTSTVNNSTSVEYIDTDVILFRKEQEKITISLDAPSTTYANIGAVVLCKIS